MKPTKNVEGLEIIGKLVWVGLDAEGNLNLILNKHNKFWTEIVIKALKHVKGHVIKLKLESSKGGGTFERKVLPQKRPKTLRG